MNDILLVCIVLLTVAAIISVVYFVIAMNQVTRTAKKLEETLDRTNYELDSVHRISSRFLEIADLFPKTWMKVATAVLPVVTSFVLKKRK
jgi:uncharacterized protein YoxC